VGLRLDEDRTTKVRGASPRLARAVLGLAGSVLGLVAVLRGPDGYEALTLELQCAGDSQRSAGAHAEPGNRSPSYGAEQAISGDLSGVYTRACEPIAAEGFQCVSAGTFVVVDALARTRARSSGMNRLPDRRSDAGASS